MSASVRVDLEGTLEVPRAPDQAFGLFTARGEEDWVPGWKPRFVFPESGRLEEDQVWLTGEGDEATIWSVIRLDREAHTVEYLRVTPGSRLARVSVRLTATEGGSQVQVRYRWTALAPDAREQLKAFAAGYEAMLAEWQSLILRHFGPS